MCGVHEERFLAHPLVCGAVGVPQERQLTELYAAVAGGARHEGPGWSLMHTRAPLIGSHRRGFTWGRLTDAAGRVDSWETAAGDRGLTGLWTTKTGAVRLHTDALGFQDVFTRRIGDALYFSNRIAPLRALTDGPLTTDWDAWGSALGFGGFTADTTPFAEIRRLHPGGSVLFDGVLRTEQTVPTWLSSPTAREATVDHVLDALYDSLPRTRSRTPRAITLSGGWDSRLIGMALARKRITGVSAWTGDPDTGSADDVELSVPVAAALGLEHQLVHSAGSSWCEHRSALLARTEHLTWLHTWLAPLALSVRAAGRPVFDGIGGDLVLRNLFLTDAILEASSHEVQQRQVWEAIGGARYSAPETIAPGAAEAWCEQSLASMRATSSVWEGHPAELVLSIMTTRTNRIIGSAPLRIFAPDVQVLAPLITSGFLAAALAVPLEAKRDRMFFRAVLDRIDPSAAALPSTNDPGPNRKLAERRQASLQSIDYMAAQITADDAVCSLLHPQLVEQLRARDLDVRRALPTLQWASAFADWRQVNAAFLTTDR